MHVTIQHRTVVIIVSKWGILYSCGLGCWGGRRAIPWIPSAGPEAQSPVAVRCGAVWLGGAY